MGPAAHSMHVSLIAIPDAVLSTLSGIYDVLGTISSLAPMSDTISEQPPFAV